MSRMGQRITLRLPGDLHRRVSEHAQRLGCPYSAALRQLLEAGFLAVAGDSGGIERFLDAAPETPAWRRCCRFHETGGPLAESCGVDHYDPERLVADGPEDC